MRRVLRNRSIARLVPRFLGLIGLLYYYLPEFKRLGLREIITIDIVSDDKGGDTLSSEDSKSNTPNLDWSESEYDEDSNDSNL